MIVLTARAEVGPRGGSATPARSTYLVKPFSLAELLARVRAQLRVAAQTSTTTLQSGDIEVNLLTRKVRRADVQVTLSTTEFELLVYLMRHGGQVLSREQILSVVWGYQHDPATNVVDVYVGYLRRKLARPDNRPQSSRCAGSAIASAAVVRDTRRANARHLVPGGLRWRLGAWVAFVVLVSCAVTFVVVYRDTGSELRHQIDSEINGEASELSQALVASEHRKPRQVSDRATRYIRGQPFSASSTLLFAIVAGAPSSSNRLELFTPEGPDNGETVLEQDHENQLAAKLRVVHDGYSTLTLPDVGNLRLLERSFTLRGGTHVTVGAGEPLAAVAHAQGSVARAFILAGALALLGAMVAAYLVGTRVSRPLRRMAEVAARVDAGTCIPHPRRLR